MVDGPLDARHTLDRRGDRRLSGDPGDQPLRDSHILPQQCLAVGPQGGGKGGRDLGHLGQSLLHQALGGLHQGSGILRIHPALGQHVLLQRVEPPIDHAAKGAVALAGRQPLTDAPVDRFHPMQGRLRLRGLHLAGGEAQSPAVLLEPAAEEVLPQPYSPRTALNWPRPVRIVSNSSVTVGSKRSSPTASRSSPAREPAAAQGADDLGKTGGGPSASPLRWNWMSRRSRFSSTTPAASSTETTADRSTLSTRRTALRNPPMRTIGMPSRCASAVLPSFPPRLSRASRNPRSVRFPGGDAGRQASLVRIDRRGENRSTQSAPADPGVGVSTSSVCRSDPLRRLPCVGAGAVRGAAGACACG